MKLAITHENGQIFGHFGRTTEFKIYEIEEGKIVNVKVIGTNGAGHGALATLLAEQEINALICGGIGGGAQMAVKNAGIELFGGVSGDCDRAALAFLEGSLAYNPFVQCNHHHEEGHACGAHGCGSHKCH